MADISDFFPSDTSRNSLLTAQKLVAERAITEDDFGKLRLIAGVDQSFLDDKIISGIIVLKYDSLEVVERVHSVQPLSYPYIPTFLSFREGPAIVSAFQKLKTPPDILMVDGAGVNHPRSAGIATHVGVALDVPTIGITKKILCGTGDEPSQVGEANPLIYAGKKVGWLLKSTKRSRAIVVAPGHRVSLDSSLSIVKKCLRGHKLPEPIRLAHEYVTGLKKEASASLLS
ncbi:MAG: endonuclease V [Candidatus Methanoperedens sp.]|nr:endonuclease V [Candidatus Methanoperedens sp.]MCZ7396863.1 endonuclease V [Candidatus Methanoperedens sp.]